LKEKKTYFLFLTALTLFHHQIHLTVPFQRQLLLFFADFNFFAVNDRQVPI
jgi:hypothetical protein